jgi:tRNA(Ile)-lysidine synthase
VLAAFLQKHSDSKYLSGCVHVGAEMNLAAEIEAYKNCRRWWIAYSGGVDSHVLLYLLAQLRATENNIPPLSVIHINHQLNPRAAAWAEHCQTVCAELGVECIVETVDVVRNGGEGLESAARSARYAAFEQHVSKNEVLLQAHHRDDQVETLLLRLLRGSGLRGLAAIPLARTLGNGQLLRPLLHTTRSEVLAYAQRHRLQWIEDDSNANPQFDRNFLRLTVLPQIAGRWPSYRNTLARVAEQAREAEQLFDALAAQDFAVANLASGVLSVPACVALEPVRRRNLLRYWLQKLQLPLPTREQLLQLDNLLAAGVDAEPCVQWPGAEVHRFRGGLYAMQVLPTLQGEIDEMWHPATDCAIPGMGVLRAQHLMGQGLRADCDYRIRSRRGGERCKPMGRAHSQTLKKLFQEYAVPPWLRDRLPLFYCGGQLAAVADLWICEGFAAVAGQSGWVVEWRLVDV